MVNMGKDTYVSDILRIFLEVYDSFRRNKRHFGENVVVWPMRKEI